MCYHCFVFPGVYREATTDFTVDARALTQKGGDHIKTLISNPSGSRTDALITDRRDGTYNVEYTPYEEGQFKHSNRADFACLLFDFLMLILFVCVFQAHTVWKCAMTALQFPRVRSMLASLKAAIQLVFACMGLAWRAASPTSPTSSQWRPGKVRWPQGGKIKRFPCTFSHACHLPSTGEQVPVAWVLRWRVHQRPKCPALTTRTAAAVWSTSHTSLANTTSTSHMEDSPSKVLNCSCFRNSVLIFSVCFIEIINPI